MGLYIKKSVKGTRIFHSATDEPIHSGWLKTDKAIKRVLIKVQLANFFKEVVAINSDGMAGYRVNGQIARQTNKGLEKVVELMKQNSLDTEASKILKSLKIKV